MGNANVRNHLIQAIPPRHRGSFENDLTQIDIKAHDRIFAARKRLSSVYFPVGAVISTLFESDRKAMEVHGVGREGMLGADILLSGEHQRFDSVCQIGGAVLRMPFPVFVHHMRQNRALERSVALYAKGVIAFLTQSVACNGLHTIAQRCARWLLVTSDRVDAPNFLLTHELLARMLGVRRSGVSVAVHRLQKLGLIRYQSGRVTIIDKDRLERESCECYRVVVRETARIFKARAR